MTVAATTKTVLALAALLIAASATASNCFSIRDADMRNYCLATERNSTSNCFSIRDPDVRNLCLANVRKQRSQCFSIRSQDLRNLCLSQVP